MTPNKDWQSCTRAANRLADLVCAMYHPKDAQARKVWPTATWAEIIAAELGVEIPDQESDSTEQVTRESELLAALESLARYANGKLGRNPYLIPEYKTALVAVARAKGKSVDGDAWMDALDEGAAVLGWASNLG